MRLNYISRGISKSQALENYIDRRMERVKKYFGDTADGTVVYRQEGRLMVCEITIVRGKDIFRCEKSHSDVYVAARNSIDTLWGTIRKYKSKIDKLRKERHLSKVEARVEEGKEDDPFTIDEFIGQSMDLVKVKKVSPAVMTIAEAAAAIDLIGHSFYIFINQETDKVSVIYKRNREKYGEGYYGVIELNV